MHDTVKLMLHRTIKRACLIYNLNHAVIKQRLNTTDRNAVM